MLATIKAHAVLVEDHGIRPRGKAEMQVDGGMTGPVCSSAFLSQLRNSVSTRLFQAILTALTRKHRRQYSCHQLSLASYLCVAAWPADEDE